MVLGNEYVRILDFRVLFTTDPMISCSTKSFGAHDDHAETGIYVCKPEMNPARSSGWNVFFWGDIEAQTIHRRVRFLLTKMFP